jgi:hypothetical protein
MKQRPTSASDGIKNLRKDFAALLKNTPINDAEIIQNLGLYTNRHLLQKMLVLNELYQKIINVHGIIIEFGVRWGQNLALFQNFRSIYEPFNFNRKIVGFDTFSGFPSVHENDGNAEFIQKGAYSVSPDYKSHLSKILEYHEAESPYSHITKHELIEGDASDSIETYLLKNKETIIALAYFDFDIYQPTKNCLKAIQSHLTKGSILVFDELNLNEFPGETIALKEVLGLNKYAIKRFPLNPFLGYLVIE